MVNTADCYEFLLKKFKNADNIGTPVSETYFENGKLYQFTITIKEIKQNHQQN